jgi:DNA-binding transcriptional ArsR family regulator
MHQLPYPSVDQIVLPTVLVALGDPTRLAIVRELARRETPMNCSMFLSLTSKTNLSYHLARLREAGITKTKAVGTSKFTTLRRDDLESRFPGLLDSVIAAAVSDPALPPLHEIEADS